ncbi:hypothetical protein ACRARG_08480 [Pseudooceanicola sp. C21-150M6]|uniref:hypothetical protein n=1 Tax=Pseudooceanicola sp. C21-150M6 TaxID=3434355 RepID=UPI003D7F93B4
MRGLLKISLLLALALPAHAQNLREAALNNVAVATRICADVSLRQLAPRPAFTSAGFTYRAENRGVNKYGVNLGYGHYFDAPADTAKAQVAEPDRYAGTCYVYTKHASQGEVEALVMDVLRSAYPNARIERSNSGTILYNLSPLPLIVSVSTISRNRYETDGTISVSMSFPG